MAVVVGAPDVDDLVKAAHGELVAVVGDIGGKVGVEPVGAAKHVVLEVKLVHVLALFPRPDKAVADDIGGPEPQRAVPLIGPARVGERLNRVRDVAALVERGLVKPGVKTDAVALQIALHLRQIAVEAEARHVSVPLLDITVYITFPMFVIERLRQLLDVVAVVTVLRELHRVFALNELEVARLDALGELLDLVARVVDIKLPLHRRAVPVQHAGERVAQHAAAGVAHVHRAGGVGGDELHHVLLPL